MDTSQYLDLFIDETKEHLQSLNEHVLVLEKEPENEDTINEIFRAAHTLKGMSGTMDGMHWSVIWLLFPLREMKELKTTKILLMI